MNHPTNGTPTLPLPTEWFDAIVDALAERLIDRLPPPRGDSPTWMDSRQAAAYLRWGEGTFEKRAPGLPRRKVGGSYTYHPDELDAWLDSYYEGPAVLKRRGSG